MPNDDLLPRFPQDLAVRLVSVAPDLVVGEMTVADRHGNRNGVMHGGAIMAFADTLGGVAAAARLAGTDRTTTLESKTNFLRAIPLGTTITGRCRPLHAGRRTEVWQTTILREDGKPAAVVTQTQLTLRDAQD